MNQNKTVKDQSAEKKKREQSDKEHEEKLRQQRKEAQFLKNFEQCADFIEWC